MRTADLERLGAIGGRIERGHGDGPGNILDIDGLKAPLGRDHRKHGQPREPGEAIGEIVLGPENDRRANDGGVRIGGTHRQVTFALGAAVVGLAIGIGADRGNMHERAGACVPRSLGNVLRAVHMGRMKRAAERADEVDDRRRILHRLPDGIGIRHVGADPPPLADRRQRVQEISASWIAACDPDPGLVPEQLFADIAADEAAAAEHRDDAIIGVDHALLP